MAKKQQSNIDFPGLLGALDAKLHTVYMVKFITDVVEGEEEVEVPASLILELYTDLTSGLELMNAFGTTFPKYKALSEQYTAWYEFPKYLVDFYKPEGKEKITLPKAQWVQMQDPVLNMMANLVHMASVNAITDTHELKACQVSDFNPDDINAVNKYCAGAAPGGLTVTKKPLEKIKIGNKVFITTYPTHIYHQLGIKSHFVEPSFYTEDNVIKAAITYHDSYLDHQGSANRLRGAKERLELLGFTCNLGTEPNMNYKQVKDIYCNIDAITPDNIRELATFFSMIIDGDIQVPTADPDAYQVIRDSLWELAQEKNQKHGDNTWQSGVHKPNWSSLYEEWKADKEYKKNVLYNEIRELLALRDKHHMVEDKLGIGGDASKKSSVADMKELLSIWQAGEPLIKKLGMHSMANYINKLESLIAAGKPAAIGGTGHLSDSWGNQVHNQCIEYIAKAGIYGGCNTAGSISNINTANLAYCEGVLKGTMAGFPSSNHVGHQAEPNVFSTYQGEEDFSGFQYTFQINPQTGSPDWQKGIKDYLKTQGFTCNAKSCTMPTDDLNFIRQTALFLSNLHGASGTVGEACAKVAIQDAAKAAQEQNAKGVFAFTQSPIMASKKTWIDKCWKEHEIPPPSMTKEELAIMKLIGADKVYGGCSFENSEIIPDLGVIKYCEGVRMNAQNSAQNPYNAKFTQDGNLTHYFHNELDTVAQVNITKNDQGLFKVQLSNIDLRDKNPGTPLQKQVLKRLKSHWNLLCPTAKECSGQVPLDDDQIRALAAYLSSFHQAYSVTPDCINAAEEFAFKDATSVLDGEKTYTHQTKAHSVAEWNNLVCTKIAGGVQAAEEEKVTTITQPQKQPALEPMQQPTKIDAELIENLSMIKKKPPFHVGGCVSITTQKPTIAKANYCAGVTSEDPEQIFSAKLKANSDGAHVIGTGMAITFTSQQSMLYLTIPSDLMHPDIVKYLTDDLNFTQSKDSKNTFAHNASKFQTAPSKAAIFFSNLTGWGSIPEDCRQKAILRAISEANKLDYQKPLTITTQKEWEQFCNSITAGPNPYSLDEAKDALIKVLTEEPNNSYFAVKQAESNYGIDTTVAHQAFLHLVESKAIVQEKPGSGEYVVAAKPLQSINQTEIQAFIIDHYKPGTVFADSNVQEDIAKTGYDAAGADIIEVLSSLVDSGVLDKTSTGYFVNQPKPIPTTKEIIDFILGNYNAGTIVSSSEVLVALGNKYQSANIEVSAIDGILDNMVDKGVIQAKDEFYLLSPKPGPSPSPIDAAIAEDDVTLTKLALNTDDFIAINQYTEYKKLPAKYKNYLHALFNAHILEAFKSGMSYDNLVAQEQKALLQTLGMQITPLMVKLQLDIEIKTKKDKGLLPPDALLPGQPGKPPKPGVPSASKFYQNMNQEEQNEINDFISKQVETSQVDTGETTAAILDALKSKFGLIASNDLIDQIQHEIEEYSSEEPTYENADHKTQIEIKEAAEQWASGNEAEPGSGKPAIGGQALEAILFDIMASTSGKNWAKDDISAYLIELYGNNQVKHITKNQLVETLNMLVEAEPTIFSKDIDGVPVWYFGGEGAGPKKKKESKKPTLSPLADLSKYSKKQLENVKEILCSAKAKGKTYIAALNDFNAIYPEVVIYNSENKTILDKIWVDCEPEEEAGIKNFSDQPASVQKDIKKTVVNLADAGNMQPEISLFIKDHYGVYTDTPLMAYINDVIGLVKKPEEEPPAPAALLQEESMASFIKQGMSAEAVGQLFGSTAESKKAAAKLYELHHPEGVLMTQDFHKLPTWVQMNLRNLASKMLSQGKTQEDTAWYISYNYHLQEDGVKQMVKNQAKKPVGDQQKLIETTIKILNVGEKLFGCDIADAGLGKVTPSTVSYCQGVIAEIGKLPDAKTEDEGTTIYHNTDSQEISVKSEVSAGNWRTKIHYDQTSTGNWKERLEGVDKVLQDLGFKCEPDPAVPSGALKCDKDGAGEANLSINEMDLIRRSALFLSSIDKVAQLPKTCIPQAIDYAAEHARSVNKVSKPWSVSVYPGSVSDWMSTVCNKIMSEV